MGKLFNAVDSQTFYLGDWVRPYDQPITALAANSVINETHDLGGIRYSSPISTTTYNRAWELVSSVDNVKNGSWPNALYFREGSNNVWRDWKTVAFLENIKASNDNILIRFNNRTGELSLASKDTHYNSNLYLGQANTATNTQINDPYIKLYENNALRNQIQLKAGSNVSIYSNTSGIATISSSQDYLPLNNLITTIPNVFDLRSLYGIYSDSTSQKLRIGRGTVNDYEITRKSHGICISEGSLSSMTWELAGPNQNEDQIYEGTSFGATDTNLYYRTGFDQQWGSWKTVTMIEDIYAGTNINITKSTLDDKSYNGITISSIDTKNTSGATNSTFKLFLIGATEQTANPQTFSYSGCYMNGGQLCAYSARFRDVSSSMLGCVYFGSNNYNFIGKGTYTSASTGYLSIPSSTIYAKTVIYGRYGIELHTNETTSNYFITANDRIILTEGNRAKEFTFNLTSTSYDQNTWYPVTCILEQEQTTTFHVYANRTEKMTGSWNTREDKCICFHVEWTVSGGNHWGWINNHRTITMCDWGAGSLGNNPIAEIGQLSISGCEYFYLRGGGIYHVIVNRNVTLNLQRSKYIPVSDQTSEYVQPKTSVNPIQKSFTSNPSTEKLYLLGATNQSYTPTSFSNSSCYINSNCLYSNGTKVSVEGHTHSNYLTSHQSITPSISSGKLQIGSNATKVNVVGWNTGTVSGKGPVYNIQVVSSSQYSSGSKDANTLYLVVD